MHVTLARRTLNLNVRFDLSEGVSDERHDFRVLAVAYPPIGCSSRCVVRVSRCGRDTERVQFAKT